jgi:hypothetical protein
MASSAGSILAMAGAVVFSTTLVFANPPEANRGPGLGENGTTYGGPKAPVSTEMDLPIQPTWHGAPAPETPPEPKPVQKEEPPKGEDPRDVPPPTFFGEEIDASTDSIIYVIDISGSMTIHAEPFEDESGKIVNTGNRLDRAKAELKKSIQGLPENFSFNIFVYDECPNSCWGSKQAATDANKSAAFGWVDAIQPAGWTNTGLAVQTALADKENKTVVLLSDGAPNFLDCGMQYVGTFDEHAKLIRSSNTQGARVNTFGIGIASDPDARGFMQRVASENGGTYVDVN